MGVRGASSEGAARNVATKCFRVKCPAALCALTEDDEAEDALRGELVATGQVAGGEFKDAQWLICNSCDANI